MAKYGRDATACLPGESEPFALVVSLPDPSDEQALTTFNVTLREAQAQGHPVIVYPWFGDVTEPNPSWSGESLDRQLMAGGRDIVWQDATLRALDRQKIHKDTTPAQETFSLRDDKFWFPSWTKTHVQTVGSQDDPKDQELYLQASKIHYYGQLADFLSSIDQPSFCGNLLDTHSQDMQWPWVVNMISDHSWAIVETEKRSYSLKQAKAGSRPKAMFAALSAVSFDSVALNEWKLVTSAGFSTFPHQDAGGFATWVRMRLGIKIWGVARLKVDTRPHGSSSTQTRLAATEAVLNMDKFKDHADLFLLFLTPGSLL
ncbi:hypothetical protein JAAARDRAFT_143922 [Jaapia argillacea MUCL 33604]|uniref:Uncharacterized protein n=1 Tax=Jaapia argillacea MUCL 33604 TaxID=933084 RepID=A0A067PDI1_9AGAM|nr:hypothetical protein JAAARDRAFT_143922 [Jaapia argillacea MUCL 33604]